MTGMGAEIWRRSLEGLIRNHPDWSSADLADVACCSVAEIEQIRRELDGET